MSIVAAALVRRETLSEEASFEAELRPFQDIELHARVSGYLDKIPVDIGDIVKENQIIASLDVPDLHSDLERAEAAIRRCDADVQRLQANFDDTHLISGRMVAADKAKPNLIAQQELDAAANKERAAQGALEFAKEQCKVAQADLAKLKVMEEYSRITAPFAGVVTKRFSDRGALIQAGTSAGSLPLIRLAQSDRLRATFPVSVRYVSRIKVGGAVDIRVPSLNRTIPGKIARFSRHVDPATRTMSVEVDIPNEDLSIIPGIYGTAVVKTESRQNILSIPDDALARGAASGTTVYVIHDDGKIEERIVETGLECAGRIEIVNGLTENERVMIGNRSLVRPGEKVESKLREDTLPGEGKKAVRTASAN